MGCGGYGAENTQESGREGLEKGRRGVAGAWQRARAARPACGSAEGAAQDAAAAWQEWRQGGRGAPRGTRGAERTPGWRSSPRQRGMKAKPLPCPQRCISRPPPHTLQRGGWRPLPPAPLHLMPWLQLQRLQAGGVHVRCRDVEVLRSPGQPGEAASEPRQRLGLASAAPHAALQLRGRPAAARLCRRLARSKLAPGQRASRPAAAPPRSIARAPPRGLGRPPAPRRHVSLAQTGHARRV